ncbi:hypothetical protein QOZ80_2BG0179900 [Eleusine coracana subsp. coracana]|nr:hypothetical protein QOZ80_2BG0179900 [Eleusine coracana subsp. coracana]
MEAEVAALSQLQLQLLALVSELRLLRERERAAREELRDAGKRWDEAEEERRREARKLRAEVEARDDALQKLEARIKCLENENEVLQENVKNLKESMDVLLQSREDFVKQYEAGLYFSVEKEVAAVKQVLGDVQCLVGEKENIVTDLKEKVQRISTLEKDFVEKINFLESKMSNYQLELRSRARIIYELKDCLEAEKLNNNFHPELEEISKAVLAKDEIIDRLTSEKQTMQMELHNMETALRKFQDIFSSIGHEGMKSFSQISESQDVQDVNEERFESNTGTQCRPTNGQTTLITATNETVSIPDVERQMEIVPGYTQVRSPFKSSALPSPEPSASIAAVLESKGDSEMGNLSLAQPTHPVNPDLILYNYLKSARVLPRLLSLRPPRAAAAAAAVTASVASSEREHGYPG